MILDSENSGDEADRRYRTGYMIYAKMALLDWLPKKQATVEKSVFGPELSAMLHGVETLRGIRYKLRMTGVTIDGPIYIFGDNMFVIFNKSRPESQSGKKSNMICYHAVREAVSMGVCMTTNIPTLLNFADLLTKVLYGNKRRRLLNGILFDIYE